MRLRSRVTSRWLFFAALAPAATALALVGCSRNVGAGGDPDAAASPDSGQPGPDSGQDQPDAGQLVELTGWRSEAFEHSGFVPEGNVDEAALDRCDPYLMAAPGGETWWTDGAAAGDLLDWFPTPGGMGGVALLAIRGYLSPPGDYGHMGGYQRELSLLEWEVLTCETVARLGHCVLPRPEDYCLFPEPDATYGYEKRLVRILPGPATEGDHYELTVTYNPDVADGVTIFRLAFTLPQPIDPMGPPWEVFEVQDLLALDVREIREWFYYQEIPYPNALSGWVLRHLDSDTLLVSISARAADDTSVHLWGHFPVDDVIAYP